MANWPGKGAGGTAATSLEKGLVVSIPFERRFQMNLPEKMLQSASGDRVGGTGSGDRVGGQGRRNKDRPVCD